MNDALSIFSLIVFAIASLSFLFVAYLAIKNDRHYKVNQLFSLAFVFAFFYFIFMGLYILPSFSFTSDQTQLFAFLGLVFINLSVATFAIVSEFIRHESIQTNDLIVIIFIGVLGLVATFFVVTYFNDTKILMASFSVLNISLTVNSLRFVFVLYRVAKKESDQFFKKKINAYNIGFILFNILSALGWTLAIFLPLGPEFSPLPPGILTLVASLLMARSFLMKKY